VLTEAVVLHSV